MTARDIVVIGGSAGSITALTEIVRALPADFPVAIFIVVHIPPYAISHLPEILARAGRLPAVHAAHGEHIRPGRIYVAPPDRHLQLRNGSVELTHGPRENHTRPAIDPLFRTAARAYGSRVIGVVLSGALYDGTAGLMAVKARGGLAIVQDPDEAVISAMPKSALSLVKADRVLPAAEIGPALTRLVDEPTRQQGETGMVDDDERISRVIAEDFAEQAANERGTEPTVYTCPDCGGVLWQIGTSTGIGFRCHVGHTFAPEVLLGQKSEELEAALWACVRLLREKATLPRQTASRTSLTGNSELAARIEEQARLDEHHADVIRQLLEAIPGPSDQTMTVLTVLDEAAGRPGPQAE